MLGAALAVVANGRRALAAIVDEDVAARVFNTAALSVVSISDFRTEGNQTVTEGTGSGIVWDKRGHIVTNYHCVAFLATDKSGRAILVNGGLQRRQVTSVGVEDAAGHETQWMAEIVGTDAAHDLAVLRIAAPPELLMPIRVGTSRGLKVGQSAYAIGNPQGYAHTLTVGLVSGLNRAIPSPAGTRTLGAIQTDAAISAGSSGGALLDSGGRLIGLSTATFSRKGTGRSSGVNFALPVDLLVQEVPRLIVHQTASGKS